MTARTYPARPGQALACCESPGTAGGTQLLSGEA
jgi:hypothetical protein